MITSFNQENVKIEKYIKEFEQLQMRVGLDEESELMIARFIKGLSPSIGNKVELQPCLSFDDVCHLAIKIEQQLKDRKSFHNSFTKNPSTHIESETLPP